MMGLTADQATRLTPMLLAGVILAGGFAAVVHLSPRGEVALPEFVPRPDGDDSGSSITTAAWNTSDWLELSDSMHVLNHLSDEPIEPPEGPTGQGNDPELNPGGNTPKPDEDEYVGEVQYVGAITMGSRSVALVTVSGKQRFVGPDDKVGKHTIVSVHPDHIIIRVDGVDRRVTLATKDRSKMNSADRYLNDRERLIEQQRLNAERQRNARGIPSPDIGDGR